MTKVGATVGKDDRFRYDENQNPGPGAYKQPSMVGSVAKYLLNK